MIFNIFNFMNIDWFSFENTDRDFPFYNRNPHVPKWGWVVLFIVVIIGLLGMGSNIYITVFTTILLVVSVLYFLKWDYKAIFQVPKARDIALAVGLFVGYMIYVIIVSQLLEHFAISGPDLMGSDPITAMTFVSLIFSLMSEELIKFIPFMFFMRLIYKYTDNRKLSVILSMLLVMIFFAYLHAFDLNLLRFTIFVQGFGSIFEFYGYIKTKNIFVSYITHLCTDVFAFALAM